MKKQYFSTILAAACLLLPGCSNDNEPVNGGSTTVEAVVGDSEVEIKLSSSSSGVSTRASIESDEYLSFEAEGLGIFCVAKDKQNPEINPPAPDIDWTRYTDLAKTDILMCNVPANAVMDSILFAGDIYTSTSIVWADATAKYFYPISNWYKYRFFGYYPVQDDANVVVSPEEISVYMEIDGHQDVLIGRTILDEDKEYAYSAKYFRTEEREIPILAFMHRLNRFTFSVEAGADYSGSKANATRMSVKEITLFDMPYKFELIAAAQDLDYWGTIWYDGDELKDFNLLEENGELLEPVKVSEEGRTKVGDALMVLSGLESYGIRVVLVDEDGNEFVSEYPLSISEHLEGGTTEGGYSYNIHMTVYGPQEIKLNSVLIPWEIVETDIPIEL